ncbi:steroid 3-ketoacyl-CoA thiolase [Amycolatopsis sp. NPDC004079]|uniref:steroid 3-ketoacyl-CoA thiolase n=1 Tax=Amycolatopsis sp. NPDC004079 TaxID=3154549 RepID=UPI00339E6769
MRTPVIIDALRTPFGKRNGELAGLKAVELLRHVQLEVIRRNGLEPEEVDQIVGGCVTQAGEQSLNITRNAWLNTGADFRVGCSTVDVSCGSAQQANHMVAGLIACGAVDVGIGCGVESMSRVPLGANLYQGPGHYKTADYPWDDPPKAQFGGAERIAAREGFTRADVDEFGQWSQEKAAKARSAGIFDREIVPIEAPVLDEDGKPTGATRQVRHDQGIRETTLEGLAALRPNVPDAVHTAGTTSQLSDGAAAVLWMSEEKAAALGLRPRARIRHMVVTGADPYYLLDGPVAATRKMLERSGMSLSGIARYEVNEAFAAVVLNWAKAFRADPGRLNVHGGAIALGHPVGATGARLIASALHELERIDAEHAWITMCCGGSLGTGTLLERI